ncbi:hypothetical protein AAC387_Pa04g1801 [Persea americana]
MDKSKSPVMEPNPPQPQRTNREYEADVNQQWTPVASPGSVRRNIGNEQGPHKGNRHSKNFQGGQNKCQHRQGNRFALLNPNQADNGSHNSGSGIIQISNRILIESPKMDDHNTSDTSSPTSTSKRPCQQTQDIHIDRGDGPPRQNLEPINKCQNQDRGV